MIERVKGKELIVTFDSANGPCEDESSSRVKALKIITPLTHKCQAGPLLTLS